MPNNDLEQLSKPELIALIKQISPKNRNDVMESEIIRAKQEEINRLHDRFKLANKAMKEGLWELDIPDNQQLTGDTPIWYSRQFVKLLGFEYNEFPPKIHSWSSLIHPEHKQRVFGLYNDFISGKTAIYEVEVLLMTKSGEYRWFNERATMLRLRDGIAIREAGSLRDIHEAKVAQQIVVDERKRLENVLYTTKDGYYEADLVGENVYMSENYYLLLGYLPNEIEIGWTWWTGMLHPEDKASITEAYQLFLDKRLNSFKREYRIKCKSGEYRWVLDRAKFAEFDENGNPIKIVGAMSNIHKQKEVQETLQITNNQLEIQKETLEFTIKQLQHTQEQLIQAEKLASIGTLVAGIAHEINNPISYIVASSEGLNMTLKDITSVLKAYDNIAKNFSNDNNIIKQQFEAIVKLKKQIGYEYALPEIEELLANISSGAEQTAEIVRGLQNFARADEGMLGVTDIHNLLDATLILLQNQNQYNTQIVREYAEIPLIQCYPNKLRQVFMNLIANAIQAIDVSNNKNKGFIKIKTGYVENSAQNEVFIEITDNGIGISVDKQKRIFEPFFTDKEIGKGTGLGLSVSLGIIQMHKGNINFISEENQGTQFTLTLPILQADNDFSGF